MTERLRIFDGHNDSVQRIREYRPDGIDFLARSTDGGARDPDWTVPSHIDLARALDGGLVGGLFAMFVRPEHPPVNDLTVTKNSYEVRLAEPLDTAYARRQTWELLTALKRLEARAEGRIRTAYVRAGFADTPSALFNGSRLRNTPACRARIDELMREFADAAKVKVEFLQERLLAMLDASPQDLFDAAGHLKPIVDLRRGLGAAIKVIKFDRKTGKFSEIVRLSLLTRSPWPVCCCVRSAPSRTTRAPSTPSTVSANGLTAPLVGSAATISVCWQTRSTFSKATDRRRRSGGAEKTRGDNWLGGPS